MIKKLLKHSLIISGILFVFIFYTNNYIINFTKNDIFEKKDNTLKFETGLVLWAAVYWNKLSDIYRHRLETASNSYMRGNITEIIISWDGIDNSYDEITPARDFLIKSWVPKEKIIIDRYGVDTYDSIYRAVNLFWSTEILVFTQEFHLPRSVYICKNFDIKCAWVISDKDIYIHAWAHARREALARIKAFYNVLATSEPEYLNN